MRTIKFRGKRPNSGKWIFGYLMVADGFYYILNENYFSAPECSCEVIPETVGQFTGLTDKNGKEIFDGDVVKWDDNSNGKYWRVCKITWNKSRFELHGYTFSTGSEEIKRPVYFKFGQFIYEYDGVLEVIGNIHDNPELL